MAQWLWRFDAEREVVGLISARYGGSHTDARCGIQERPFTVISVLVEECHGVIINNDRAATASVVVHVYLATLNPFMCIDIEVRHLSRCIGFRGTVAHPEGLAKGDTHPVIYTEWLNQRKASKSEKSRI